ncbi:MAG: hypothetical protein DRJ03_06710 [Chloroflexi bacterium]|nr:MAG: hypothetical protein DRJ03_06710 [Chloroflexota bacterium]
MANGSLTAAAIISFCKELEDKSSTFYGELAERWPEGKEMFQVFSKAGEKHKTWVVRTYQETISDALEASYAFEGMNLADYVVETALAEGSGYTDALETARALEEKACAFYLEVAERSESLLATIPMAFKRVAKKRNKRKARLQSLLDVRL